MRRDAVVFWGFVLALWAWFAGRSVGAHFSTDDTNNLFTYWGMGWSGLLKANVLFFLPSYRPMGGVLYYSLYSLFGLEIVPFRVACLGLIALNSYLLYLTMKQISSDRYTAAAVTMLASVHPALWLIYYSNGTLFDILCYAFSLGTLLVYWRGGNAVVVLALLVAALNSKEMAVVLPLVCAVNEWQSGWKRKRLLLAMTVVVMAFALGKVMSPLAASASYHPVLTLARYLETSRSLLGDIFLVPFSSVMVLGLYGLMAAHTVVARSRELMIAFVVAVIGFVPLNFITPREPFVVYLPLCGWALYAVLTMRQLRVRGIWLVMAASFLTVVVCVWRKPRQQDPIGAQEPMWRLVRTLREVQLKPRGDSCVLMTGDPFYPDWDAYFLAKLQFNDRTVRVMMTSPQGEMRGDTCATADYRVVVEGGEVRGWVRVQR